MPDGHKSRNCLARTSRKRYGLKSSSSAKEERSRRVASNHDLKLGSSFFLPETDVEVSAKRRRRARATRYMSAVLDAIDCFSWLVKE